MGWGAGGMRGWLPKAMSFFGGDENALKLIVVVFAQLNVLKDTGLSTVHFKYVKYVVCN